MKGVRGVHLQVDQASAGRLKAAPTSRLILVSNRLPISARPDASGIDIVPSSGGLATGLRTWHERSNGLWVGWPGDVSSATADQRTDFDRRLNDRGIVPVHLSADQIHRFYDGFANRVVWPLFHYSVDRVPADADGWGAYCEVNRAFADAVVQHAREGDVIWVHDYQLMLLPAMLRARLPRARIGFFLHIPFPSAEIFRILPWRQQVIDGLLGADLIGFHTMPYVEHFASAVRHLRGAEMKNGRLRVVGRSVHIGAYPMGVDADAFAALAATPSVCERVAEIKRDAGGRRLVLGVDRLDYTKGIPRRLEALERLLQRRPDLRDDMRYIQIAVPSRGGVDSYQQFRAQVEERVGHINGTYGTLRSLPVHYVNQSVTAHDLVALYRAADVLLVTPLRDGMNLVAKEFVASRIDDDGVLVLSEFAGAAAELNGAVTVNPYDVDMVADEIERALAMPLDERSARMRRLRTRVHAHTVDTWASAFLERLTPRAPAQPRRRFVPIPSFLRSAAAALLLSARTT
jgi:trehalose 6-phosphate synthase/phosphatase